METTSRQTQCPVSKLLQRCIKEVKFTVLLVFFFDTCQMSVKSCVLYLFPVPKTGRSHIINILLALVFSVGTVNYGSSVFFHRFMARARIIDGKKKSVRSLQHGPKTRLIRGM